MCRFSRRWGKPCPGVQYRCKFSRRRGKLCPGAGKTVSRRRGKVIQTVSKNVSFPGAGGSCVRAPGKLFPGAGEKSFNQCGRTMRRFSRRRGKLCPGALAGFVPDQGSGGSVGFLGAGGNCVPAPRNCFPAPGRGHSLSKKNK